MWDPAEFRSDFGLRSLSKYHENHPFYFGDTQIRYEPARSSDRLKGGNSNWRGPVWFPTTFMMIESLRKLGQAYGDSLSIYSGSAGERGVTLLEMAEGFANRMISLFTRGSSGYRPVFGSNQHVWESPHWRDLILFHEFFHGDTGEGLVPRTRPDGPVWWPP